MDDQALLLTLQRYLDRKVSFDELLGAVDAAQTQSPEELAPFNSELEVLYARGTLEFELYSILKNRLDPATRAAADTGQLGMPTDVRQGADFQKRAESTTSGRESRLEPGVVIHKRFVLEERLGSGGMGVVFKARDTYRDSAQDRDPYVALKFLNSRTREDPILLKAFEREARRHMKLSHPNILIVHDFIDSPESGVAFLHMELLSGEPLDRLIDRHKEEGLPFKDALPLIEGAAKALIHAHAQKVIHSDFKPGNVFALESRDVEVKVKVLDFGIARPTGASASANRDAANSETGVLVDACTLMYASPEILLKHPASPSDDIYALACVAYELMSGKHPFGGTDALQAAHAGLKVKRPRGMKRHQYRAIVRGLAFKQASRTESVKAFLEEFKGRESDTGQAKRRVLRAIAVTAVLLGVIGLGAMWYLEPTADDNLTRRLEEEAKKNEEARKDEEAKGNKPGPAAATDPKTLLEMGNLLLDEAKVSFDPGLLSENQMSAYGAFSSILRFEVNPEAIDGIVEIVHLYEAEAQRRLDAGDFVAATELADYGLAIDKDRKSLQDIRSRAQQAPLAAPE